MSDTVFSKPVTRRQFLQMGGFLAFSLLAQGLPGWAAKSLTVTPSQPAQQKLVVIFLRGAADALSILVPYGDPAYYKDRNSIAIPRPGQTDGAIALDPYFGINPHLENLMPFWNRGQLAFVLNSGSPDATRSHFDAQDYMETGTPGIKSTESGWMNRFLQVLPNNNSPTRAINMEATLPRILQGAVPVARVPLQGNTQQTPLLDRPAVSSAFETLYRGQDALGSAFREGMEAHQSLSKSLDSEMAAEMIAANRGALAAGQFSAGGTRIAQLLKNDPSVQTVFVALGGWDTHVNQGSTQGAFGRQLQGLGAGLSNLLNGLQANGQLEHTTIVVMSEFGRTVQENGNRGTDHGHGNMMWVMGGPVRGKQLIGHWQGLNPQNLHEGRDLPVTTDFRTVFSDLFSAQYGLKPAQIQGIFPHWTVPGAFSNSSLFKGTV